MIVKRNRCDPWALQLGGSGENIFIPEQALESLFYASRQRQPFPVAFTPPRRQNLARIAFLGSQRVKEGFSFHNTLYPLKPLTWKAVLRHTQPHYVLLESCLYDSEAAWPQRPFQTDRQHTLLRDITDTARKQGIPSLFWHTMGPEYLDFFADTLPFFDVVACAEMKSITLLAQRGIQARLLPHAFAPERFNPLSNFVLAETPHTLLFDGTARMLRFAPIRDALQPLVDCDLRVVDTAMVTTPYTLQRFTGKRLASVASSGLGREETQALYRAATAYLSLDADPASPDQATRWRTLEAAACRTPVLHLGMLEEGDALVTLAGVWTQCADVTTVKDAYLHLRDDKLAQERAGHLAWRAAHAAHTFAHRMDTIHEWFCIARKAVPPIKASIMTPSIRPECLERALTQYENQTWPDKEFVYVFNGAAEGIHDLKSLAQHRPDIRVCHLPYDYSTGMVVNAGLNAATGDVVFKLDDDDLYGDHYVADRIIYFREFQIVALGNTRSFMAFSGDEDCMIFNKVQPRQDCISTTFGHVEYALSNFTGATVAYDKTFALNIGYQEQVYANADVSFLRKSVICAPHMAIINMDILNFCVLRGGHQGHTWAVSKDELRGMSSEYTYLRDSIFV